MFSRPILDLRAAANGKIAARTSMPTLGMSVFGDKADIASALADLTF
jgi:hypothetical protein